MKLETEIKKKRYKSENPPTLELGEASVGDRPTSLTVTVVGAQKQRDASKKAKVERLRRRE